MEKEVIEHKLFKWILVGGLFFWVHRISRSIIEESPIYYLAADIFFLLATISLLYLLRFKRITDTLKIVYCGGWIVGFVYYWYLLGGLTGPMTYVFFSVISVFMGFIPKRFKEIFAVMMCSIAVILAFDHDRGLIASAIPLSEDIRSLLPIDYVLNSVIITIAAVLLKNTFDRERQYIERQNLELGTIEERINKQNDELFRKSQKIESIKNNLETIINERTAELESRHKLLEQYAYDNAHVVRKPLTNIQGLLNVLEIEKKSHNVPNHLINDLRNKLKGLDEITKKINASLK